jgi:hypothetical protein
MEHFHEMLIEDEIVLCGVVLALGIAAGAVSRMVKSFFRRRETTRG